MMKKNEQVAFLVIPDFHFFNYYHFRRNFIKILTVHTRRQKTKAENKQPSETEGIFYFSTKLDRLHSTSIQPQFTKRGEILLMKPKRTLLAILFAVLFLLFPLLTGCGDSETTAA